jgi:hypothetical protein
MVALTRRLRYHQPWLNGCPWYEPQDASVIRRYKQIGIDIAVRSIGGCRYEGPNMINDWHGSESTSACTSRIARCHTCARRAALRNGDVNGLVQGLLAVSAASRQMCTCFRRAAAGEGGHGLGCRLSQLGAPVERSMTA